MFSRRVVVTGLGLLTPVGTTVLDSWHAMTEGRSGVALIEDFVTEDLPTRFAARVKGFDSSHIVSSKDAKKFDVFVLYGVEAARQALSDSGLVITEELAKRAGVVAGSGIGGLPKIEETCDLLRNSPKRVSPFFIPGAITNMIPGMISMLNNLQGPNFSIVSACATGGHNIGEAARLIRYGVADVMVCGASEMSTGRLSMSGFSQMRALSRRNDAPTEASRPWDTDRDGFVLGEGAGMLVLEEYEHAQQRGAHIYAEFLGFGMSSDAHHMTAPEPNGRGFIASMQQALSDARIHPSEIDYINAHGTSTPVGDPIEVRAVKNVFGSHAHHLAISSTKSMIGHTLGASGAIEAIVCIMAIQKHIAPPTINLFCPDTDCDLNFVPHHAQERCIRTTLSNSFGFGGTNTSLIFRAID